MKSLIRFFVENSIVPTLTLVFMAMAGFIGLSTLKREGYPKVDLMTVNISTIYPGATPKDVEEKVTIPIEEKLREVDGIEAIKSTSRNSESLITIKVEMEHPKPKEVVDDIRRVIDRVTDLPKGIPDRPLVQELKSANFPVLEVAISGENMQEVQDTAYFLKEEISEVKGVLRVEPFAKRKKEWQVLVNPEKKKQYNIGMNEIGMAIQEHNISLPAGSFSSSITKDVRTASEFESIEDLLNIPVRGNETGAKVLLRQIGFVRADFEKPRFLATHDHKNAIVLSILKKENADIIELVDAIQAKLKLLKTQIPKSIQLTNLMNEGNNTRNRIKVVTNNAIQGFALVIIVLFIFLSFRDSILTSLSLPLALLTTLVVMGLMGISFNLISMLGVIISLGMLVDNSIVISENIYKYRMQGMGAIDSAIQGTSELASAIIASYLTTVAAFLPMLFMTGIMGKFVWQIPAVVIISLTSSLFESFFLLPSRVAIFGKVPDPTKKTFGNKIRMKIEARIQSITASFGNFIQICIRNKYKALASIFGIFVFSIFLLGVLKFNLFPKEGVEYVLIKAEFPTNYSAKETQKKMEYIEKVLDRLPKKDLVSVVTKIGSQQTDNTDTIGRIGENLAAVQVLFIPETNRKKTAEQLMEPLQKDLLATSDAVEVTVEEMSGGPPVGAAVTLAILGKDYPTLEKISEEIQAYLKTVKGVINIRDDYNPGREEIVIQLNDANSQATGISAVGLAQYVRSQIEGAEVTKLRKNKEEIKIKIIPEESFRKDESSLRSMYIQNKLNLLTPINSLAIFERKVGKEAYLHYDFEKAITVTAGVQDKYITSGEVNALLWDKFSDLGNKYPGYEIKFKGEEEDSQKSMASLGRAGILAFFGIYAILAFMFRNYSYPILIFTSVPLGLVGVIFGFLVSGKALSFLAMIGIIGLAGVVVNTSIILMETVLIKRKEGLSLNDALVQSASDRLRPIFLTTVTTMAGLIPTAYGLGGTDPVLVPMTLALAWGLGFGTFGSLILIPIAFSIGDAWKRKKA